MQVMCSCARKVCASVECQERIEQQNSHRSTSLTILHLSCTVQLAGIKKSACMCQNIHDATGIYQLVAKNKCYSILLLYLFHTVWLVGIGIESPYMQKNRMHQQFSKQQRKFSPTQQAVSSVVIVFLSQLLLHLYIVR